MIPALLVAAGLLFAILAIRAGRLIVAALWLAGLSAVLATLFYLLGAYQVAVIELSVGAGLVTVLFVFAISVAGEEVHLGRPVVPRWLALALVAVAAGLLAWHAWPGAEATPAAAAESDLLTVLWEERGLDMLVQIGLIFSGVLGLLGLLAEAGAPLEKSAAAEVAARRDQELLAIERKASEQEKELA